IEWPQDNQGDSVALPPQGITHHFCRLGIVTVNPLASVEFIDCRCLWPALTNVPRLFYVSGDGQETMPDLTASEGLYKLPQPLIVGVANAQCLKEPLTIGFVVTVGDGGVVANGDNVTVPTKTVEISTDTAG